MTNNQLTDKRQEHGTSALTIGYYMCRCPECGWFGSSEDIHGDHEICDCPNCSTEVEDLDVGSLWNLVLPKLAELQERRKAERDSEPVAYTDERNLGYIDRGRETAYLWGKQNSEAGDVPLYRHAQQPVVDADDNFYSWFGREWQENYQHNQYTTAAKQMLGVMAESAWKAGHRAAMLNHPSSIQPNTDATPGAEIKHPSSNSPVIPEGYVMVPKEITDEIGEAIAMQANCCGGIALDIYDAMLAAAPQEVKP